MDPKHSVEMSKHLDKQNQALMETYRTMSHELHKLQVEEETIMRKLYDIIGDDLVVDEDNTDGIGSRRVVIVKEGAGSVQALLDSNGGLLLSCLLTLLKDIKNENNPFYQTLKGFPLKFTVEWRNMILMTVQFNGWSVFHLEDLARCWMVKSQCAARLLSKLVSCCIQFAWEQAVDLCHGNSKAKFVTMHTGGTLGLFGLAQRYSLQFTPNEQSQIGQP